MTTVMCGPLPQHLVALAAANVIRLARAELKRDIMEGTVTVEAVLRDVPVCAATMTVGELLRCQRRWGQRRCGQVLVDLGVRDRKLVGSLTERQRFALIGML